MNEIDTAEIRDRWETETVPLELILDLCDALDAARAERDASYEEYSNARWKARAEAAEARIAAALGECDRLAGNETLAYYMPGLRRALTGGES